MAQRFYGDDLARIHNSGFLRYVQSCGPEIIKLLRKGGVREGRVLDIGCGGGSFARALHDKGYEAWGLDVSQAMIKQARHNVPEARFIHGSCHNAKLPELDAVTSMGECVSYLNDKKRIIQTFENVFGALRAGGLFIFDMPMPERIGDHSMSVRTGDNWTCISIPSQPRKYELRRSITTFTRTTAKQGQMYRKGIEDHRLATYPATQIASWLRRIGFRVRPHRGYGKFRFPMSLMAFTARKPH